VVLASVCEPSNTLKHTRNVASQPALRTRTHENNTPHAHRHPPMLIASRCTPRPHAPAQHSSTLKHSRNVAPQPALRTRTRENNTPHAHRHPPMLITSIHVHTRPHTPAQHSNTLQHAQTHSNTLATSPHSLHSARAHTKTAGHTHIDTHQCSSPRSTCTHARTRPHSTQTRSNTLKHTCNVASQPALRTRTHEIHATCTNQRLASYISAQSDSSSIKS
jgi:hypothetical protein